MSSPLPSPNTSPLYSPAPNTLSSSHPAFNMPSSHKKKHLQCRLQLLQQLSQDILQQIPFSRVLHNKVSVINDEAQVWEQDSPQTHVYRRSFVDAANSSKRTHSQFKFFEELIEMLEKDALPEIVEVKFVPKENLT
uniref:Uncharacterized protein n=1 Tax=Ditylenchus dipsaci TaxID=166011 RepID=A0A915E9Y7_9BILA